VNFTQLKFESLQLLLFIVNFQNFLNPRTNTPFSPFLSLLFIQYNLQSDRQTFERENLALGGMLHCLPAVRIFCRMSEKWGYGTPTQTTGARNGYILPVPQYLAAPKVMPVGDVFFWDTMYIHVGHKSQCRCTVNTCECKSALEVNTNGPIRIMDSKTT